MAKKKVSPQATQYATMLISQGRVGTPSSDKFAAAVQQLGKSRASGDPIVGASRSLKESIDLLRKSNIPLAERQKAADIAAGKKDESVLTKALNLITKPKTAVVAGIARIVDPERNFLKDLRHNVGTADVLAGADWFKNLPTGVKIGVGLVGDIALDPLTYLAPQAAIGKLGGAKGVATEASKAALSARNAAKAAEGLEAFGVAAQLTDDAIRLEKYAGQLLQKGKGGIGGLNADDLRWLSAKTGQDLRGGLYLNAPGTGRVGQFVVKKLTGAELQTRQLYLGRNPLFTGISKGAFNTVGRIKTSGVMAALGEKYGGGLGVRKRAILNAATPEDALKLQRDLDLYRVASGGAAKWTLKARGRINNLLTAANDAGLTPQNLWGVLDNNPDDVIAVRNALGQQFVDDIVKADTELLTGSAEQVRSSLRAAGFDDTQVEEFARVQEMHASGKLTDEAIADMKAKGTLEGSGEEVNFQKSARKVVGGEHLGEVIPHPTDNIVRATYTDEAGRTHVLLDVEGRPAYVATDGVTPEEATAALKEKVGPSITREPQGQGNVFVQGDTFSAAYYDEATGKVVRVDLPESQINIEPIAPSGMGPKTKVNAINREKLGYDLFDTNYTTVTRSQVNSLSNAILNEIRGRGLVDFGYALDKGMPDYAVKARRVVSEVRGRLDGMAAKASAPTQARVAEETAAAQVYLDHADQISKIIEKLDNTIADAKATGKFDTPEIRSMVAKRDELALDLEQSMSRLEQIESSLTNLDSNVAQAQQKLDRARARFEQVKGTVREEQAAANLQDAERVVLELTQTSSARGIIPDKPLNLMTVDELEAYWTKVADAGVPNQARLAELADELDQAATYESIMSGAPMSNKDFAEFKRGLRGQAADEASRLRERLFFEVGFYIPSEKALSSGKFVGDFDWFKNLSFGRRQALRNAMNGALGGAERAASLGEGVDSFFERWARLVGMESSSTTFDDVVDQWISEYEQLKELEKFAKGSGIPPKVIADGVYAEYGVTPDTLYQLFAREGKFADKALRFNQESRDFFLLREGIEEAPRSTFAVQREIDDITKFDSELAHNETLVSEELMRRNTAETINEFNQAEAQASKLNVGDDIAAQKAIDSNVGNADAIKNIETAAQQKAKMRDLLGADGADWSVLGLSAEQEAAHLDDIIKELQKTVDDLVGKGPKSEAKARVLRDRISYTQGRLSEAESALEKLRAEVAPLVSEANLTPDQLETVAKINAIEESVRIAREAEVNALRVQSEFADEARFAMFKNERDAQDAFKGIVFDGMKSISSTTQTSAEMAEMMAQLTRAMGPNELPSVFRYFDKLTTIFKSYAVASPGFIMRNGMGGMFNNYLLGVSPGRYWEFMKADRAFLRVFDATGDVERALAAVPERLRAQYRLVHESGVLAETSRLQDVAYGLTGDITGGVGRQAGVVADNPLTRSVYSGNARMERVLRGAAAMDAATTGRIENIYDVVFKAHFDYADLNRFEVNVMKRVSPFYTWTRKNLPLQMEMFFKNPKAYNRYVLYKNNIEAHSNPEDLVPSWMSDRLNIRLPFQGPGGQMYIMPDLPFKDLSMLTNIDEIAGSINPIVKLPIELQLGNRVYFGKSVPFKEGYVAMPDILKRTGIGNALEAVGWARRDKKGELVTTDQVLYAAEQFFPFFGKARRLLPSEQKYNERAATTWVNFLFGGGFRTNTKTDQLNEIYARQSKIDELNTAQRSLGYGGYQNWSKRVGLSRAPLPNEKRPYLTLNQPKGGLSASSAYTNTNARNNAQRLARAIADIQAKTQAATK